MRTFVQSGSFRFFIYICNPVAPVAELVDALDSKSCV